MIQNISEEENDKYSELVTKYDKLTNEYDALFESLNSEEQIKYKINVYKSCMIGKKLPMMKKGVIN